MTDASIGADHGGQGLAGVGRYGGARWIAAQIAAQEERHFCWIAVGFALGIAGYFALPVEPARWIFLTITALVVAGAWWIVRGERRRPYSVFCLTMLAGFACGGLHASVAPTVMLPASTGAVTLSGEVIDGDPGLSGRQRIVVAVRRISGIREQYWPQRVRLALPGYVQRLAPGTVFSVKARLSPLPGPVEPDGYDFGRRLWFEGIGATGVGWGEVTLGDKPSGWAVGRAVFRLRQAIVERLYAALDTTQAGIAAALIVGIRSGIPDHVREQLQIAGLAHILAISGLHMTLVAGGMFWAARAFLAAFEGLALRRPIKKWAAAAALAAGAFYLVVSGAGLATQRAFIMLAIMLLAIMFDRPAISMRNLAIAALVLLTVDPFALMSAGFQMSFLAVMGLIATYEHLAQRRLERPARAWPKHWMVRAGRSMLVILAGMALTTLVASAMTGIPAIYHFNRPAPYSLPANLLALPVVTFVIMPAATVAGVLMPLGLEKWPLLVMGWGIDHVTSVAGWIAGLPGAGDVVRQPPQLTAGLIAAGAVWFCLWRAPLRWLGVVPAVAGFGVLAAAGPAPDILMDGRGRNVAVRNADGFLVPANAKRGRFAVERWLARDGDGATLATAAGRPGWTCDDRVCLIETRGRRIAYILSEDFTEELCNSVEIVLSAVPLKGACKSALLRIDRFDVWREGSQAITIEPDRIVRRTAASTRGDRPWRVEPIARRLIRTADNPLPPWPGEDDAQGSN